MRKAKADGLLDRWSRLCDVMSVLSPIAWKLVSFIEPPPVTGKPFED